MTTEIAKTEPTPAQIAIRQREYADFIATQVATESQTKISKEDWASLFLGSFRKVPALYDCNRASVIASLNTCAQLNLRPGTSLGHAYLIPFAGECTLIIGYKGFLELAHRTGKIRQVFAEVVFHNEVTPDLLQSGSDGMRIVHTPRLDRVTIEPDAKKAADSIAGAYAVCRTTEGGTFARWISVGDIEARRKRGASGKGKRTPWDTDYLAMARKTAVRALFGSGEAPMSEEMGRALEFEDEQERESVAVERKSTGPGVASVGYDTLPGAVQIEAAEPKPLHPDVQRLCDRLYAAGWLDDAIAHVGRAPGEWTPDDFNAAKAFGVQRKAEIDEAAAKVAAFGESGGEE